MNGTDPHEDSTAAYRPYPAPGRPEQPMPARQSPWPSVVVGAALALGTVLVPLVLYAILSGHPG